MKKVITDKGRPNLSTKSKTPLKKKKQSIFVKIDICTKCGKKGLGINHRKHGFLCKRCYGRLYAGRLDIKPNGLGMPKKETIKTTDTREVVGVNLDLNEVKKPRVSKVNVIKTFKLKCNRW